MRIPTSAKVEFCNNSRTECLVFQSWTSIFRSKNNEKKHGNTHITRYFLSKGQGTRRILKLGFLNPTEIDKNPSLASKCPFLCSPNVPSQDAKVKPPSMPNERLRYQECQDSLATVPRICNPKAMDNHRGPAAEGVAHKINIKWLWGSGAGQKVQKS